MTAVAKALDRQNGWLRQNIELEAQHIAKLSAGKLQTRMAAYNAQLVAAVDSNTAALNELFGPPPAWTWPALPWRSDRNVDIYNGLGSVWRHLAKDWSAEGNAGVRALNSRVTSLIVDELQAPFGLLQPLHAILGQFARPYGVCGQQRRVELG